LSALKGGFFFHPSDEDLSPGTPAGKSHSAVVLSVYSNWRTAITQNWVPQVRISDLGEYEAQSSEAGFQKFGETDPLK
jgi:hypothetical protein